MIANFVVNFKGKSELVKVTPDVNFATFSKLVLSLVGITDSTKGFIYAIPNDFSSPVHLDEEIYQGLVKSASTFGNHNVIHLRLLVPESFIFQVNPHSFMSSGQTALNAGEEIKAIEGGQAMKQITHAGAEGFHWQQVFEEQGEPHDPNEFISRYSNPESLKVAITPHKDAPTLEIKDRQQNVSYAARISLRNEGTKRCIAMNWSLKQVLAGKKVRMSFPLPDLEPGQTYDFIFNLNIKPKLREVTHWSLSLMDSEAEELYFGDILKAELKEGQTEIKIIPAAEIPVYISSTHPSHNSRQRVHSSQMEE